MSEVPVFPMPSTVYGPVHSWRFGSSLGIDLIVQTSTCSFNCIYCQLGYIQSITSEQRIYVETERVLEDLKSVDWDSVDVVTLSGSGEPTLALNIGDVIAHIKDVYSKQVMVLTNATMLHDKATRDRLWRADTVACKLDAWNDDILKRYNRPADGVSLSSIIAGIKALRADGFPGKIAIQSMFMPMNAGGARELADLIAEVGPDEIHLNTPKRPYPREWHVINRGNHDAKPVVDTVALKTITLEEAQEIEAVIRERNPRAEILSVYEEAPEH